jgi:hypothetical protein
MMALKLISRNAFGARRAADPQQSGSNGELLDSAGSEPDSPTASSDTKLSTPITPPDRLTDDGAEDAGANGAADGQAAVAAGGRRLPAPKKRSLRKGAKHDSTAVDAAKKKAASKRRKSARIAQMQRDRENGGPPGKTRGGGKRGDQAGPRPARLKLKLSSASGPAEGGKGKAAK